MFRVMLFMSMASLLLTGQQARAEEECWRVPHLIRGLRDEEALFRGRAAAALGSLGDCAKPALPELLKSLHDQEERVRRDSLAAIMMIGPDESAVSDLLWVCLDRPCSEEAASILWDATDALAKVGEPAVPALIELLAMPPCGEDTEWAQGGIAAQALGKMKRTALPGVLAALGDPRRRIGAVRALGWMGSDMASETVPTLVKTAGDPDPFMRGATAFALWQLGSSGAAAVPALITLLSENEESTRSWAVQALQAIGPGAAEAVPELRKQLAREKDQSASPQGPWIILDTLGAIGPSAASALPEIRALLEQPDEATRNYARRAIEKIEAREGPARN